MCERFCLISSLKSIEKEYKVDGSKIKENHIPNINIGLGENALVITNDAPHKLQSFRFGFTPFWARKKKKLLNAPINGERKKYLMPNKLQPIFRKAMFRLAIRQRRCLVLANAFYAGQGKAGWKKPYLIYRESGPAPFALGGLWDEWIDDDQNVLHSFAIVTTPAGKFGEQLGQEKSPLLLNKSAQRIWLDDSATPKQVNELLQPMAERKINAYRISSRIKKNGNKNPSLLKPLGLRVRAGTDYDFYAEMELAKLKDYTKRKKK